jgi:hypothetical protein
MVYIHGKLQEGSPPGPGAELRAVEPQETPPRGATSAPRVPRLCDGHPGRYFLMRCGSRNVDRSPRPSSTGTSSQHPITGLPPRLRDIRCGAERGSRLAVESRSPSTGRYQPEGGGAGARSVQGFVERMAGCRDARRFARTTTAVPREREGGCLNAVAASNRTPWARGTSCEFSECSRRARDGSGRRDAPSTGCGAVRGRGAHLSAAIRGARPMHVSAVGQTAQGVRCTVLIE